MDALVAPDGNTNCPLGLSKTPCPVSSKSGCNDSKTPVTAFSSLPTGRKIVIFWPTKRARSKFSTATDGGTLNKVAFDKVAFDKVADTPDSKTRARIEGARRAPIMPLPGAERQMQGLLDMAQAGYEQAATRWNGENRAGASWDLLQRAKPQLKDFDRLLYWLEAGEALSLALLGEDKSARVKRDQLAGRLVEFPEDGTTLSTLWATLARVSLVGGDHEDAAKWWRLYLDSPHAKPVYRARGLCDYGESLRALGDEEGARRSWQEVVDLGFDTAATRRALAFGSEVRAPFKPLPGGAGLERAEDGAFLS